MGDVRLEIQIPQQWGSYQELRFDDKDDRIPAD